MDTCSVCGATISSQNFANTSPHLHTYYIDKDGNRVETKD